MLKIRLRQQGKRNHRVFRLVLTDVRYPRDGKYMELLGFYDPHQEKAAMRLNDERIKYWLDQGAEMTDNVKALVKSLSPEILVEHRRKKAKVQERKRQKRRAVRKKEKVEAALTV